MIFRDIPIETIRPLQRMGVSQGHLDQLAPTFDLGIYMGDAIVTEFVNEDGTTENLLLDGTHRAYLTHLRKLPTIGATVLETDEDFRKEGGAEYLDAYGSLERFRDRYRYLWRPGLVAAGIIHIADLPVIPGDRQALFDTPEWC